MYQGYPGGSSSPFPGSAPAAGQMPGWSGHNGAPNYAQSYPQAPSGPAPTMAIAPDPNAFAQMYRAHLGSLTFNSKPIITNLTVMAHENVHTMANTIAQCVDEHITQVSGVIKGLPMSFCIPNAETSRRQWPLWCNRDEALTHLLCVFSREQPCQSPPPYRLPAMYTLDSISKNIGSPYTELWAQRIAHVFLETYRVVDHPTKVRLEELLGTWRQGGPDGRPLFGGDAQWDIERNLYGSQGPPVAPTAPRASPLPHPGSLSPVPPHGRLVADEKSSAIEQIDRLLALASQEQQRNPQAFNPTRMLALRQLKGVVQTASLSPQEMGQIQKQLNALGAELTRGRSASSTPTPAPAQPTPQVHAAPALPLNLSAALADLAKMASGRW